ncbi:ABC transporter ATP-binding protein [Aequorivita echinoideorum]|uniref:ABC transporter ATP-binding protein n=1 Tax=Aequorivita echinoideorum TaxID=1549647 RepID=A0ABS5S7N4_9FLAO|nr:ABC transporter ATP-binding protein [Aequorivita echinoideorum]MBT0608382.1 ABC transporter ATP-binding protein [Aequorivita echinoideorum]
MLHAKGLTKIYSSGKALDSVSISLKAGSISGLLGKNGAGKSTLFKILCNLVTADEGKVEINSNRKKPIGAVIEHPGLYSYLNAYDNLKIFASMQNAPSDRNSLENYLRMVGLPLDRKDPVQNFSMGMKQRLGIAIALLNDPEILILDEPFSGLDPIGVASLITLIKKFASQGIAIFISSHLMAELHKCCDYLYIIDNGAIVNHGPTFQLINNLVSIYTLTAENISNSSVVKKYAIHFEKNNVTVNCVSGEMPILLKELLEEGFQVTACVPNITLEQLLKNDL